MSQYIMKINKILIPIDFSKCSINALEYALLLSKFINAKMHILHVHDTSIPMAKDSIMEMNYEKNVREKFELLKGNIPFLDHHHYELNIVKGGTIPTILETVRKQHADLIVMGTQGAGNKVGEWLGSTTYEVMDETSCPVLAIPSGYKFVKPRKLLFATDYIDTEHSKGLDILYWFSEYFDSEIHLLNIGEEEDDFTPEQSQGAEELHDFFEDTPHAFHFLQAEDVEQGLNEFIDLNQIDLLALMPKKHKVLEKLFQGSLTKVMAHHSKIPLLTFHEEDDSF